MPANQFFAQTTGQEIHFTLVLLNQLDWIASQSSEYGHPSTFSHNQAQFVLMPAARDGILVQSIMTQRQQKSTLTLLNRMHYPLLLAAGDYLELQGVYQMALVALNQMGIRHQSRAIQMYAASLLEYEYLNQLDESDRQLYLHFNQTVLTQRITPKSCEMGPLEIAPELLDAQTVIWYRGKLLEHAKQQAFSPSLLIQLTELLATPMPAKQRYTQVEGLFPGLAKHLSSMCQSVKQPVN